MCGWVGVFGAVDEESRLRDAAATLASRGPDGSGTRVVARGPLPVALAHRRLAILDPTPAGAQPMVDAERGVSVVYNGEIYNSPELRRQLESHGARFRSGTDTEVLLVGWSEWGDEVLERIDGIFSFALVDERNGRALLARDRLGVKPLYWAKRDAVVLAGSAPRAILALRPELRPHIDHVAIAQLLTLLWIPHPRTPWKDIHKLPPGSALSIADGEVREWRYWHIPDRGNGPLDSGALRSSLAAATQRQLLSDVPVGLLLSGGLDSSLLLELMVDHYGDQPLHALTAGFETTAQRLEVAPDDARFARMVANRHPQVELAEVVLDTDPESDVDELAFHFDDPVADPAAISLYRLARHSSTKVLFSGVGAEELFGGYPRHRALRIGRAAARMPKALRCLGGAASPALRGSWPGPAYGPRRNVQKLLRAVSGEAEPHYWRMLAQLTAPELRSLLPGVADAAGYELDSRCRPLRATRLADALAFDREQFLPNLNLAYVDKAAMAAGVEVRVPLLDEMVSTLAAGADPETFTRGRTTKAPLREAAAGLVPHDVIHRAKTGFGAPSRAWVQGDANQRLRERVDALADANLVERQPARRLFDTAATGRLDSALAVWSMICLQAWHDEHVNVALPTRS